MAASLERRYHGAERRVDNGRMATVEYDLNTSGGLMPQIQALIAPPTSEERKPPVRCHRPAAAPSTTTAATAAKKAETSSAATDALRRSTCMP
ncbi:PHD finger protein 12-like, partial [Rhipicephalus sanguineus]|uniref:PHD finger protein 12-like n=1 Tax=Rhipicephalus sanguineus TaxID=34632 RepID=UPI0020C5A789